MFFGDADDTVLCVSAQCARARVPVAVLAVPRPGRVAGSLEGKALLLIVCRTPSPPAAPAVQHSSRFRAARGLRGRHRNWNVQNSYRCVARRGVRNQRRAPPNSWLPHPSRTAKHSLQRHLASIHPHEKHGCRARQSCLLQPQRLRPRAGRRRRGVIQRMAKLILNRPPIPLHLSTDHCHNSVHDVA